MKTERNEGRGTEAGKRGGLTMEGSHAGHAGRWMVVADVKGASSDFARSAALDAAAAAFDETAQKTMRENAESEESAKSKLLDASLSYSVGCLCQARRKCRPGKTERHSLAVVRIPKYFRR